METIQIRYVSDQIERLTYIDNKSDWIDLRAAEDVVMKKGEHRLISLGVAMKLPEGYEAHIVPRSSTYKNFGLILANHMGVVDGSYCGDNDISSFGVFLLSDNNYIAIAYIWYHAVTVDLQSEEVTSAGKFLCNLFCINDILNSFYWDAGGYTADDVDGNTF